MEAVGVHSTYLAWTLYAELRLLLLGRGGCCSKLWLTLVLAIGFGFANSVEAQKNCTKGHSLRRHVY